MKGKDNKKKQETIKRLRDQYSQLDQEQARIFLHNEINNKTKVKDIIEALNIPRATIYRIKKNPNLKAKGRRQLNNNQSRLYLLFEYLKWGDFSVEKKKLVAFIKNSIKQHKFQMTTKPYEECKKIQTLFQLLKELLQNKTQQQPDSQFFKECYIQFLKLLVENNCNFNVDNKKPEIIFENQQHLKEIINQLINIKSDYFAQQQNFSIDQNQNHVQVSREFQLPAEANLIYEFQNRHQDHGYQINDNQSNHFYEIQFDSENPILDNDHFLTNSYDQSISYLNHEWQYYYQETD
ncbi:hypothetical protein ABPG74_004323 [Tetrahymena malaccensis]